MTTAPQVACVRDKNAALGVIVAAQALDYELAHPAAELTPGEVSLLADIESQLRTLADATHAAVCDWCDDEGGNAPDGAA